MRPVVKPLVAVALALAGVASCSDDDPDAASSAAETTTATTSETEPPGTDAQRESDGVLKIGVLLPQTGEGAAVGIPSTTAASNAVDLINAAGGVFGEN